ncbi:MAG: hypothetical protein H0V89_03640 [Deltaproteobacteria bacterium]|nr:hypothetical protein [Deltaproteobacteria bacterium]
MTSKPKGSELLPRFAPLLSEVERSELDTSPDVTCGVFTNDLVIGYVNEAWLAFGRANGASKVWGVGDSLLGAISGPLRAFYAEKLASVPSLDPPAWEHDYECSSPTLRREFRLRALSLAGGAGLLITHSLRVERAHDVTHDRFVENSYRSTNGIVTQCGHCRRVRRVVAPFDWEWAPELVARPPAMLSHGLCGVCLAYYFGPGA